VERVGQYVDFEIGGQSIVVVRTEEGLRAYFNACRHRGTRLVQGQGRIGEFRCPFHAWRWNLDGSLKYQADEEQLRPRPADELCLPECRVDTWGGWVFINMDGRAEPLADYLAPLPERLDGFKLEDMRIAWYKSVILPANWKTSLDAFIESWHVPGTHPQLLRPDKHPHRPPSPSPSSTAPPSTSCSATTPATPTCSATGPTGTSTSCAPTYGVDPTRLHNVEYSCASSAPSTSRPTWGGRGAAGRPREPTARRATPSTSSCARSMPGPPASTTPTSPRTS
jgi:phenylpropionate dioxygenase-like ring-hydroxylating dioxygenase large terminal subunit